MKYSKNKVCSLSSLEKIILQEKKRKRVIVFTNGCFDLLHPGHIKLIREAKRHGDILIVAINSDTSIKKIKGKKRPILDEEARVEIITALEDVDFVVMFKERTPYKLIKRLQPDILVKGGEWSENEIVGRNLVKKVIRIKPLRKYSTTKIIDKIINTFKD